MGSNVEEFIDMKIEEFGRFNEYVSVKKGTDNYNKLKSILMDVYEKSKCGEEHLPFTK